MRIVILLFVIIISLIFKYYIFQLQYFKQHLLEDFDIRNNNIMDIKDDNVKYAILDFYSNKDVISHYEDLQKNSGGVNEVVLSSTDPNYSNAINTLIGKINTDLQNVERSNYGIQSNLDDVNAKIGSKKGNIINLSTQIATLNNTYKADVDRINAENKTNTELINKQPLNIIKQNDSFTTITEGFGLTSGSIPEVVKTIQKYPPPPPPTPAPTTPAPTTPARMVASSAVPNKSNVVSPAQSTNTYPISLDLKHSLCFDANYNIYGTGPGRNGNGPNGLMIRGRASRSMINPDGKPDAGGNYVNIRKIAGSNNQYQCSNPGGPTGRLARCPPGSIRSRDNTQCLSNYSIALAATTATAPAATTATAPPDNTKYLPLESNINGAYSPSSWHTNMFKTMVDKKYIHFDNDKSHYIYIDFSEPKTKFTICFWIYVIDYNNNAIYNAVSITNVGEWNKPNIQCEFSKGRIAYLVEIKNQKDRSVIISSVDHIKKWTHVAYTYNKSDKKIELFVNGASAGTAKGGEFPRNQKHIVLGRSGDNNRAFNGYMRQFVYYHNRVLDVSDINKVYRATE